MPTHLKTARIQQSHRRDVGRCKLQLGKVKRMRIRRRYQIVLVFLQHLHIATLAQQLQHQIRLHTVNDDVRLAQIVHLLQQRPIVGSGANLAHRDRSVRRPVDLQHVLQPHQGVGMLVQNGEALPLVLDDHLGKGARVDVAVRKEVARVRVRLGVGGGRRRPQVLRLPVGDEVRHLEGVADGGDDAVGVRMTGPEDAGDALGEEAAY